MKKAFLLALAATTLAAPAFANHHGPNKADHEKMPNATNIATQPKHLNFSAYTLIM